MSLDQRTWNEWSVHVLKELERLNIVQKEIQADIQRINDNASIQRVMRESLDEHGDWKDAMEEVCSVTQFSSLIETIDSLKTYRIQSITVFLVVQALVLLGGWVLMYKKG